MRNSIIDASKLELEDKVVNIKRVTKVVKGGRKMRFAALVVVGDKNGHVGAGLGKAYEVPEAIRKAKEDATKKLITLPLDENGSVIQTMRSWSTLMPGEIYSCVGCHEDNNTAPNAAYTRTLALDKGIEKLYGDVWMDEDFDPYKTEEGFDYLKEVQPILDKNCTSCHNNKALAYSEINVSAMSNSGAVNTVSGTRTKLISLRSSWKYITSTTNSAQAGWNNIGFDDSSWSTGTAGFGDRGGDGATVNTTWNGGNNWPIFIIKWLC